MKTFFDPKTVALIGASTNPSHPGHNLFLNMQECFRDRFFPVNPKVSELNGTTCYPDILSVPTDIDLAVVFIPARAIPPILEQCAAKGIRRIIIESGGFAETGPNGLVIQEKCLEIARRNDMRIWGPNCMGLINVTRMKVMSFMPMRLWKGRFLQGKVSMVVQSGMLSAGFLSSILNQTPFGLAKIASIGNKIDVDESDVMEYLINDPDTGVIALYLESIKDGRRFFNLCRSTDKPIVILKSGRTESGAQAATSHTASLAQNDSIVDGALRQAGVIRVYDMNELLNVARSLGTASAACTTSKGRIAVLTFSGGAGVVAADSLADMQVDLAEFSDDLRARLKTVFPDWMDPENPLDIYPATEQHGPEKVYHHCLEAVLQDPGVDGIFMHLFSWYAKVATRPFDRIAELARANKKLIVTWLLGADDTSREFARELEALGIPVVDEISKGVRVLSALLKKR